MFRQVFTLLALSIRPLTFSSSFFPFSLFLVLIFIFFHYLHRFFSWFSSNNFNRQITNFSIENYWVYPERTLGTGKWTKFVVINLEKSDIQTPTITYSRVNREREKPSVFLKGDNRDRDHHIQHEIVLWARKLTRDANIGTQRKRKS